MKRTTVVAVLAGSLIVLSAPIASASCALPPPIEESFENARSVFVATVTSLGNLDRDALMAVEEIWKGPAIPAEVAVSGAADPDPNVSTSVDRTFQWATYVVFADSVEQPIRTSACSPTQELTDAIALLRPAEVGTPTAADPAAADDGWPGARTGYVVAGVTLGVVLLAGAVALSRNRARRVWSDGFRSSDRPS